MGVGWCAGGVELGVLGVTEGEVMDFGGWGGVGFLGERCLRMRCWSSEGARAERGGEGRKVMRVREAARIMVDEHVRVARNDKSARAMENFILE